MQVELFRYDLETLRDLIRFLNAAENSYSHGLSEEIKEPLNGSWMSRYKKTEYYFEQLDRIGRFRELAENLLYEADKPKISRRQLELMINFSDTMLQKKNAFPGIEAMLKRTTGDDRDFPIDTFQTAELIEMRDLIDKNADLLMMAYTDEAVSEFLDLKEKITDFLS